ncbi:mechanosensitive ion channel family protein [soil metagenome]
MQCIALLIACTLPLTTAQAEPSWLTGHLPPPLLAPGPLGLLWWQWLGALPLLFLAWVLGHTAERVLRSAFSAATRRTATTWDDLVLDRMGAPISATCTLIALTMLLPVLDLSGAVIDAVHRDVRVAFYAVLFWAIWRLIEVGRQMLAESAWAVRMPSSRSLVPLGARLTKVVVAAFALVALLSSLGFPVASLIAGLGIGGLALALAAQKTVENLFGAFSIGIDQPFREGDFVKVADFVGTVEAIGLRSTRFRTLDRTLVSLPNGKLADMRLESYSARDRMRLAMVVGLVYETTGDQMRSVLAGLEHALRVHPKIWPDAVVVRFSEFAASSLNIEIMAWFQTHEWSEFQKIRQEILLTFMDVVESAGTSFAFPTTTVHFAPPPDRKDRSPDDIMASRSDSHSRRPSPLIVASGPRGG